MQSSDRRLTAPEKIQKELLECRRDPSRIIQMNTLDNLAVVDERQMVYIEERTQRGELDKDIVIVSEYMMIGRFREITLPRYAVIIWIEALGDVPGVLSLEMGRYSFPFVGLRAPVVVPFLGLQFGEVKIRYSRPVGQLHRDVVLLRIFGCNFSMEYRRELTGSKLLCENEFSEEDVYCTYGGSIQYQIGTCSDAIRFPCPSKYFDDDPTIDWFNPTMDWISPNHKNYWRTMLYSPHLRDLARTASKTWLSTAVRRHRAGIPKRARMWLA